MAKNNSRFKYIFSLKGKIFLSVVVVAIIVLTLFLQLANPFEKSKNQSTKSFTENKSALPVEKNKPRDLALNNKLPTNQESKSETPATNESPNENPKKIDNFGFVPGKIILKVEPKIDLDPSQISQKTGLTEVSIQKLTDTTVILSSPDLINSENNQPVLEVDKTTKEILDSLREIDGVISSNLDVVYKRQVTTNDSFIGNMYHLNNTGQTGGVSGVDVDAFEAWGIQTGSDQVIIAVIDDGVDVDHPDLAPNILRDANSKIVGYDFVDNDDDTDISTPIPDWGHGTHVAGTIAARGNNSVGVSGVCQTCKIMPVRVLGDFGGTATDIAQGIIFAADNGASIINLSLGGPSSPVIEDAINYAYSKGVLPIAAAGNDSTSSPFYPAAYTNSLSVASITHDGTKSDFSNFGSTIDVSAYGSQILSTLPVGATLDPMGGCGDGNFGSSNDGYGFCSGTSMAAPVAAGVAGLILSQNPSLSVDELRSVLLENVDDVETLNPNFKGQLGSGSVDAFKSINGLSDYLISMKTLPIIDQNLNGIAETGESVEVPLKFNSASFSPQTLTNVKIGFSSDNPLVTLTPSQINPANDIAPGSEISASLNFSSDLNTNSGLVTFTINLESDQFNKSYSYSLDIIRKIDFSQANFTFDNDSQGWYADNSNWKLVENCPKMTTTPKYWHFGGNNCSGYSENQSGTLKSPAIQLPSSENTVIFSFDNYLENELDQNYIYDRADVLIKKVGQPDSEAVSIISPCNFFSISLCGKATVENMSMTIPEYFQGETVQFLFNFSSDNIINKDGWYIDNINLQSTVSVKAELTDVFDANNNLFIEPNEVVDLEYTYTNNSTTAGADVVPSFDTPKNITFLAPTPIPSFNLLAGETKVFIVQAQVANQPKNTASWFVNNKVNNILVPDLYGYSLPIQIVIPVPFNDDLSQSQIFDLGFGFGNWRYTPTNCPNVGGNAGQIYFGTDICAEIPVDTGGGFFVTPALTTTSNKSLELIMDQYIDTQSSVGGIIDGSIISVYSLKLQKEYSLIGSDACLINDLNGDYYSQCSSPEWHTSKFIIPQEVVDNGPFELLFDFRYTQNPARTADTLGWFIDSIKIQEVNLPPVIGVNPVVFSINVNQPLDFNLITEANISDPENDALNITLANPDKGGQIVFDSATQTYIYTPPIDFEGIEKIDYEVVDAKGNITKGSIEFVVSTNSSSSSSSNSSSTISSSSSSYSSSSNSSVSTSSSFSSSSVKSTQKTPTSSATTTNLNPVVVQSSQSSSSKTSSSSSSSSIYSSTQSSTNQSVDSSTNNSSSLATNGDTKNKCESQNLPWVPVIPFIVLIVVLLFIVATFIIPSTNLKVISVILTLASAVIVYSLYINRQECQNGWWVISVMAVTNTILALVSIFRTLKR